MSATFGLLVVCLASARALSIPDSGWRPISSEKVFSSRNFIKTQAENSEARNSRDSGTSANIELTDGPETYFKHFQPDKSSYREKVLNPPQVLENTHHSSESDRFFSDTSDIQIRERKAKMFPTSDIRENEIPDVSNTYDSTTRKKFKNTYQITEEIEDTGESNVIVNEKYQPKIVESSPTKDFLRILSSYNIRSSDRLPNYTLSLRQNSRIWPEAFPMPLRYNSPDHLLVDPLLAVLLSNYGYYLQGYFGRHGNYQNLYGYSAANNIHNNKPFGAYKLYSDNIFT